MIKDTKFGDLFEYSSQPVCVFNKEDYRFLYVNKEALKLLGYSESEFKKLTIADLLTGIEKEKFKKSGWVIDIQKNHSSVYTLLKKTGEPITIKFNFFPVSFSAKGAFLAYLEINFISEQYIAKDIEAGLNRINTPNKYYFENSFFEEIGKLAHLGGWEADLITDKITWSDETCRIHGYEPGEIEPNFILFYSHLHPEDRILLQKSVDEALIDQNTFESKYRIIDKSGETKYLFTKVIISRNEKNTPIKMTGFNMDITEFAIAEKTLFEGLTFVRGILDSLDSQIAVIDEKGFIQLVNKSWKYSITNDNIPALPRANEGSNYFDICRKEIDKGDSNAKLALDGINAVLQNEMTEFEMEYPCRDERGKRWFYLKAFKLRNEGKEIVLKYYDITDRKIASIDLNKALNHTQSANKELEQFAYIVSHDLNEPLRMISGFLDLLKMESGDQLNKEAQEYIHFALDGARRMRMLIESMLQYSRVGRHILDFTNIDLNETLQYILRVLKTDVENLEASIKFPMLPVILASKTLLPQLFLNLISNALKYKSSRTPLIEIGYEEKSCEWLFYVKDNGVGIEELNFEKIFLIFQQFHQTDRSPGNGIGLAICKKIVEKHGGKIWVTSIIDEGSIFYFTIAKKNL